MSIAGVLGGLSAAKTIGQQTQIVSSIANALPDGKVKSVLQSLGALTGTGRARRGRKPGPKKGGAKKKKSMKGKGGIYLGNIGGGSGLTLPGLAW